MKRISGAWLPSRIRQSPPTYLVTDSARRSRGVAFAAVLLSLAMVVSACGGDAEGEDSGKANGGPKPVLDIGIVKGPASLNPAIDSTGLQNIFRSLTNESLTHRMPDGSITPGLATEWRYVGDGNRVFEMKIREDAVFSDGTPVTAESVKGWLEYFSNAGGPFASSVGEIEEVTTAGNTVTVRLVKANPLMPLVMSEAVNWGFVSSPTAVENPDLMNTDTYGAGMFKLVPEDTVANDHYTLEPNPHYYDQEKVLWSKVVVRVISTPASMLAAMKTGQVDVAFGDVTTADAAKEAGFEVLSASSGNVVLAILDRDGTKAEPLGDPRVRQAMNYAIDREAITDALYGEYAVASSELVTTDGYDPEYRDYYSHDPGKARQLLAQAGYPEGFTVKVITAGYGGVLGDPPIQAMAEYLEEVGITLDITTAATDTEYNGKVLSGEFPAFGFTPGSVPMWLYYALVFAPNGTINPFKAADPVADKLFEEGSVAEDPIPYWQELSRRLTEQGVYLTLAENQVLYYVGPDIGGVEISSAAFDPYATNWFPK